MTTNKIIKHYPLSSPQRDIWFNQILYSDVPLYNIGGYLRIDGYLEVTVFEQALNQVMQENDALHIILHQEETLPVQEVVENVQVSLIYHDFSEQDNAHVVALAWMTQEFVKPFPLDDGLLCQFALCKISAQCYYWFQKYHQLIVDEWAISIIVQRVAEIYNGLVTEKFIENSNSYTYLAFVEDDQTYLNSEAFVQHERYWREKYDSLPEPLITPRFVVQTKQHPLASQRTTLSLKPDFYHQLTEFAVQNKTSLFQIILTALYCYFVRTGLREDLAIGLEMPNRNTAPFEQTIGCFAILNPAWFRFGTDLNGLELLKAIDLELQQNNENQAFPLTELNQRLGLPQENRKQLFDITLSYVKHPDELYFNGNPAHLVYLTHSFQANALSVQIEEFPKSVNLHFDSHLSAFSEAEMALIKARIEFILGEMIHQPLVSIHAWQIMPETELHQILYEFNDTATEYPSDKCIHHLFEEQVEQTPNAIAVVFEEQSLTYTRLNQKANQLAHHLQTLGVKPEVLVGICVERSLEMVIGLLGILKAGGAYVPLDPAYPAARLAFMLEDADVSVLLTFSHLKENLPSHHSPIVCLDGDWKQIWQDCGNLDSGVQSKNLAYVIYTSGSTGKPKGVMVEHCHVVNILHGFEKQAPHLTPLTGIFTVPFSFDVSVWEIFSQLCYGGTLHVLSQHTVLETDLLVNYLLEKQISSAYLPPALLELIASQLKKRGNSLQRLLVGVEPIAQKVLQTFRTLSDELYIINGYGPTEATVCATFYQFIHAIESERRTPIGQPAANYQIYILNANNQPQPLGIPGELCIAGRGLARGYFNRPELTKEKFFEVELFGKNKRIYKTGDLAQWLLDGNIEYLGRIDHQVKLRGFRIELGEIETILRQHPLVQEAVVILEEHETNQQLIAYVVCHSTPTPETEFSTDISQWEDLYDDAYSQLTAEDDPTFNIGGWNDSYTGQLIPTEDIHEWLDLTVGRILGYHPKRVLEIGCGTGLLLFRLAPHCTWYCGTDISSEGLRHIDRQIKQMPKTIWPPTPLYHQPAHHLTHIQAKSVDMVIINSVVGHFPNIEYLVTVLEKAINLVSPGGVIFVGDVVSLPLRALLHASVQLYKAPPSLSKIQVYQRVQQQLAQEDKLVIDPGFFIALKQHLPSISHVSIQLKPGRRHNEMTRFRYDVTLHVETAFSAPELQQKLDWQKDKLNLALVQQILLNEQPKSLAIQYIPNARILSELKIIELLNDEENATTVAEIREILSTTSYPEVPDPTEFGQLAEDLAYAVYLTPSLTHKECYHAIFQQSGEHIFPVLEDIGTINPWTAYANNPQQWKLTKEMVPQLRSFVKEALPNYMVPAAFVLLSNLPLTPNGKIDRRALSATHFQRYLETSFVAPRTPTEEKLAEIWVSILGVDQVGIDDNFFELGGHSLQATQVISRIRDSFACELPLHDLFASPTIAQLSEHLDSANPEKQLPPITPVERNQVLPLSFAQQGLWFLDQLEGENAIAYNESWALLLAGFLNKTALEHSLQEIVQRHEILRTTFPMANGKPMQKIHPSSYNGFNLVVLDLQNLPVEEQKGEEQRLFKAEALRPFDLSQGPLFRAMLISKAVDKHVLLLNLHHIIFDGWSQNLFLEELSICYEAFSQHQRPALPPLAIQYVDFAAWQRQWLSGERFSRQLDYWKQQLAGAPALLPLPTDFPRPPMQRFQGAACPIHINVELTKQLQALSNHTGATLFMTLLSSLAILLARYSGQSDIVIGSPIANRTHSQTESLIGFFINTLVLRLDLSGNPSVETVLQQARRVALEAYNHQEIPFEQLVEELNPERNLSHAPLFQVILELQDEPISNLQLSGLTVTQLELEKVNAKFDLSLILEKTAQGLVGEFKYNTDLFKVSTIERLIGHFKKLLDGVVKTKRQSIYELPLLTEAEQQQLLAWNNTATDYPTDKTIVDLFEQQVEKTPDNIAVVFEKQQLSYCQLNDKANQLAHYLLSLKSQEGTVLLRNNPLIAIAVERSVEMVIGLLGILKAGGAYVPIDLTYPSERIRYMLDDCATPLLLTQNHLKTQLSLEALTHDCVVVCLEETAFFVEQSINNPLVNRQASDLAYVIYTSGSTGKPKGVMVEHVSVINLLFGLYKTIYALYAQSPLRVSLNGALAFDTSVKQLIQLLFGHTLNIIPNEVRFEQKALLNYLQKHQIDVFDCTPSHFNLISEELLTQTTPLPRIILLGGEPVNESTWQRLQRAEKNHFYNLYGPTECTVDASICAISNTLLKPVIGRPITNTRIYILNAQHQSQPPGLPGELCIAGAGIARGYLNRPELTAEKFVEVELFGKTERIYKTGDLARWLPDGNLEYLGRIDSQIKLRGFRIELGEIEAVLNLHEAIKEGVVILYEADDKKRLVAYLKVKSEKLKVKNEEPEKSLFTFHSSLLTELKDWLKAQLPDYMIPSQFMRLEKLPLTPNGKIDRKALPAPELNFTKIYQAPRNDIERQLAQIWSRLLKQNNISIHDNFFELGGDSILSIQVVARAHQVDLPITARDLFKHQTIAELATVVGFGAKTDAEQGLVTGEMPLTPIQQQFFEREMPEYWHFNQSILLRVPSDLNIKALSQALAAVLSHHDALRLRYRCLNGHWQSFFAAPTDTVPFVVENISLSKDPVAELDNITQRYQSSLNLIDGPVMQLVLLKWHDASDRLFWCIHHLVVDGVSWRILQEDLHTAYTQIVAGQRVQLPAKTSSFKTWADRLTHYAQSEVLAAELANHWQTLPTFSLPVDNETGENCLEHQQDCTITLSCQETEALLREVPAAYETHINDVLLTALALALADWTFDTRCLINLEGHGRVALFEDIDLSRTVGWFTTIHPVALMLPNRKNLGTTLKAIKEQLRRVPHDGIGYGLLNQQGFNSLPKGEILFNYLGQIDQGIEADEFTLATETISNDISLKGKRKHLIDIDGAIRQGQLYLTWSYSGDCYRAQTIEALAANYQKYLIALIQHCQEYSKKRPNLETLLPLHLNKEAQVTLFGLPGLGSKAGYFFPLAKALDMAVNVYGLESPGLDGQGQIPNTVEALAQYHLERIRFIQPTGPYYLMGHSFGATVAFEMAWHLEQAGETLALLAIFDQAAPQCMPANEHRQLQTELEWLWEIVLTFKQLANIAPPFSLDELKGTKSLNYAYRTVMNWLKQEYAHDILFAGGEAELRAYVRVYQANALASSVYQPQNKWLRCPIDLFCSSESLNISKDDWEPRPNGWGWKEHTLTGVRMCQVTGSHFSMLTVPQVQVLAEKLTNLITKNASFPPSGS